MKEFDPSSMDSGAFTISAPEDLASKLHEFLLSGKVDDDGLLTQHQKDFLEESRIRLLSDAVIASHLISDEASPRWLDFLRQALEGKRALPAIQCCPRWPVQFMVIDGSVTVLLPKPSEMCTSEQQLEAINEIYESQDAPEHWIIDLSEHEVLSDSLLGYLVGFQREQEARGKRILLLWVRDHAIPTHFENLLVKRFGLFKRGHFLMSRL